MAPEVSVMTAIDSIADFRAGLATWRPSTDEEAAKYLALRSLLSGKAGDAAKDAANARLMRKCENCEFLDFDGFRLKPVFKSSRTPVASEKVAKLKERADKLAKELKEVQTRMAAEQEIAGYEDGEPSFSHWLVQ